MDEDKINKIFLEVSNKIKTAPPKKIKLNNNQKLKFYGLYKVATIGKLTDENRPKPGFFDFETKYKNEAWEKCSVYSQIEAKIEYITYYCEVYEQKIDLDLKETPKLNLVEFNFPDFGSSSMYSTNAGEHKKEMDEFLKNANDAQKAFQKLKDDIYSGEIFTDEILSNFELDNKNKIQNNIEQST